MVTQSPTDLLIVKTEIEQVLYRYARGVDRKDWQLVRSAYHRDAIDVHGTYEGCIDGLIEHLKHRHENIEQSLHVITNILIEMDTANGALVESYFICYQRLKSAADVEKAIHAQQVQSHETLQLTVVGRYIDRFEIREDSWKIARRQVAFDVLGTQATPRGGGLDPTLLLSKRNEEDVLFQERRRVASRIP